MSQQFTTFNQLAKETKRDPRTLALAFLQRGIEPDAELKSENRPQKLYGVDKVNALAADILTTARDSQKP